MTEPFKSNPCPGANNTIHANTAQLSEQAEKEDKATGLPDFDTMTRKEIRHMFYEMQAKQIEAEHHNEKLLCQLEESPDNATLFGIVTENMLDMVALTDMEGTFIFAGKSHAILGYEPDFLIGKNVTDFVHPEDLPYILEEFADFVASGHRRRVDYRNRCKDGSYLWLETWGNFITDENGIPQKIIFSSRDITERKLIESYREMGRAILQILNEPGSLQESIQRVLATLKTQTGVDAVGLRLQEGEDFPYFVQDGFSKDFLLTENRLVERGRDGGVCRNKDGNVNLECTCGLVISGKTDPSDPLFTQRGSCWINDSFPLLDLPSDQDLRIHPRNNCIHHGYASVALIPVRTSDRIVGLIQLNDKRKGRFTLETIEILEGIAAHIGSALMRKQAEKEQEKLQAQLNQAQKMESVGRLAGGVAHDFNNMLTIINGYAEMMADVLPSSDPMYESVQEIQDAGKRSAVIVHKLLAFARKQTIDPVPINLNDSVSGMLRMLQRLIGENIDLVWKPCKNAWLTKMDNAQVDQILANLVVNAHDAIADIGKLTIETQNVEFDKQYCDSHMGFAPGQFVMLAVSDTGCGMEKEVFDQLFEPFFTTKEIGKGTGLGLPMVYGIVRQNNGFINVYSEPGQGTTFRIYLPRHTMEAVALSREDREQYPLGNGETILVLEDEIPVLNLAKIMLEKLGYKVLPSNSVHEALSLFKSRGGAIDLLLTDVIMPEMNGRDFAVQVNTLYPDIKTLFMSGYTSDVIVRHGILEEGVYYIQKPFSIKDLAIKVREAVKELSE